MINSIYPNWPAPKNIKALTTTRQGGISELPYDSLNLGMHVNDRCDCVSANRIHLKHHEQIPTEPFWLNQTHSTNVININQTLMTQVISPILMDADGSYSDRPKQVSVVLTADCLPVLFCNTDGNEIASAHAGWRGLCHGVLENTVSLFKSKPTDIIAWLGPAIGPNKFEVGEEVKQQFIALDQNAAHAFKLIDSIHKKYMADLYLLARQRLNRIGISQIYGGDYCTYSQPELFYSYRRQNITGRMASMIWFE